MPANKEFDGDLIDDFGVDASQLLKDKLFPNFNDTRSYFEDRTRGQGVGREERDRDDTFDRYRVAVLGVMHRRKNVGPIVGQKLKETF